MSDFSGEESIRRWYDTIGKNGWRLEEFQHYYGNCTFDDNVTASAANFLLRFYLTVPENRACKMALDKAIDFILRSQYPFGGWPQRFPPKEEFSKGGRRDYSSFYTFNDGVIRENIHFLINCYAQLNDRRMEDPIRRGMNFYILSQHPSGGWGEQYDKDLKVAGARSYEPAALLPQTTFENAMLLLQFYKYTGDEKFLVAVPKAIDWLEKNRLKECQREGGQYTHPTFIDPETGRPIYVHRIGSNVMYGYYYCNEDARNLLIHYHGKCHIPIQELKEEYNRVKSIPSDELKKFFLFAEKTEQEKDGLQKIFGLRRKQQWVIREGEQVDKVLQSMDSRGRWLVKHCMTSHPYVGDGVNCDLTDEYACTFVGDETDTSPFPDTSDQEYISTKAYIQNMNILMNYISSFRAGNLNANR
jgi:PelA/Pel-15E family pectate lyase